VAPGRRIAAGLSAMGAAQRGHLFGWVPVCLAAGVGAWFAAGVEPGLAAHAAALLVVLGGFALAWRLGPGPAPVFLALACVAAGYLAAGARAHLLAAPVLEFRYYGPVEGRVVLIDRSASDAPRLTLDRVRLSRVAPAPACVRVALHGIAAGDVPAPGEIVALSGHLAPPGGPVEPGGFDFQRRAWFDRLGAVGYTRSPVVRVAPAAVGGPAQAVRQMRAAMSQRVQAAMPGPRGAFAAAILTGDRSAIPADTQEALRASNLAHLLAISGLHMGLLAGTVLGLLLLLAALLPPRLAARVPARRLAAAGALAAAGFYLALSGGNVATSRAFVMVAVMLGAVMLGRRAVTLRAVALAATILLLWQPEVLGEPGFQMSFAATVALVAVFGALAGRFAGWPSWARWGVALVISSAVAGAATAPVAAAHFNRIAAFGLVANLASVPLMGAVVMPAAVAAAALAPLGLEGLAFAVMSPAIGWILGVAHEVAAWPGAVVPVHAPPGAVLPLMAFGGLVCVLWQGRARWAGLAPVALGLALWAQHERPVLLVAPEGTLMGAMTGEGRALSRGRGAGFAARVWLENDGDAAGQEAAHARLGDVAVEIAGRRFVHVSGRGAAERAAALCAGGGVVIASVEVERGAGGVDCTLYDPPALRETGSLAWHLRADGLEAVTAKKLAGQRMWNDRAVRERLAEGRGW